MCVYGWVCVFATVAYEHENSTSVQRGVPLLFLLLCRISNLNMKTHLYTAKNRFFQTSDKNVEPESEFSRSSGVTAPQIPTCTTLLVSQFRGNVRFKAPACLMVDDARKRPRAPKTSGTETQLLVEPGRNQAFSLRVFVLCTLEAGRRFMEGNK